MATETASVLFTDIVASTALRERLGEDRADVFRRTHDALMTTAVEASGGQVVKGLGDGVMAVFSSAADAVVAAIAIQVAAAGHGREVPDEAFRLRVGISVGDVTSEDDDYFGAAVVEAARLCDAAQGNQILVADLVRALARGRSGLVFESVGELELKGIDGPVPACFVSWEYTIPDRSSVPFPALLAPSTGVGYAGRLGLLADVGKAWELARAGEGSAMVLLSGEPGVGKTRTSSEVARRAFDDGALVLYGRCDEELALAYEPFVEALDHQTRHDPALPLGRFPGDLRRLLVDLGERVDGLPDAIRSDPRAEEHRLLEGAASWLLSVASEQGLVLVVDDLHWATRPTLQMLLHCHRMLSSSPDARALIIATYRDTDVDRTHPLFDMLGDLRRMPNVERLAIDPLSEGEVMDFIADVAGHDLDEPIRALARRAHAETEGNPYFVGEVLRHFVETGVVTFVDGRWSVSDPDHVDVPEGVRDVVGRRLNRLSDTTNHVLTAAAVVGRDFPLHLVATVAELAEDPALDALDEAMRARLVEEVGADRFRFAHALTRQTLYEELSATRRRRLHRRVVAALEERSPGDLAGLAHHSIEGGPVGGDVSGAVRYSIAAGRQAMEQRAVADARNHFDAALELLEDVDDPDPTVRLQASMGRGETQRDMGDPGFRDTLLAVADEALERGDVQLAVEAAVANSRGIESVIGITDHERVRQLERILEVFDGEETLRALLMARLAGELGQHPPAVERRLGLLDEARAIARASGDALLLARVLAVTLNAGNVPDRLDDHRAVTSELLRAADAARDPNVQIMARCHAGISRLYDGDATGAMTLYVEAAAIARDEGTPGAQWMANCFVHQQHAWDGDVATFREGVEASLARGMELGEPDAMNWYSGLMLGLWFASGEFVDHADLFWSLHKQWPETEGYLATWTLSEVARGRHQVVLDAYREDPRVLDGQACALDLFTFVTWQSQAMALSRLGLPDEAQRLLPLLEPHCDRWVANGPWIFGPVRLGLAHCHVAIGNLDDAEREAELAWELVAASGMRAVVPNVAADVGWILEQVGSVPARATARSIVEVGLAEARALGFDRRVVELEELAVRLDEG